MTTGQIIDNVLNLMQIDDSIDGYELERAIVRNALIESRVWAERSLDWELSRDFGYLYVHPTEGGSLAAIAEQPQGLMLDISNLDAVPSSYPTQYSFPVETSDDFAIPLVRIRQGRGYLRLRSTEYEALLATKLRYHRAFFKNFTAPLQGFFDIIDVVPLMPDFGDLTDYSAVVIFQVPSDIADGVLPIPTSGTPEVSLIFSQPFKKLKQLETVELVGTDSSNNPCYGPIPFQRHNAAHGDRMQNDRAREWGTYNTYGRDSVYLQLQGNRVFFSGRQSEGRVLRVGGQFWLRDYTEDEDQSDFLTEHCHDLLMWDTLLRYNLRVQQFTTRQEGTLSPPYAERDRAWESARLWNAYLAESAYRPR